MNFEAVAGDLDAFCLVSSRAEGILYSLGGCIEEPLTLGGEGGCKRVKVPCG